MSNVQMQAPIDWGVFDMSSLDEMRTFFLDNGFAVLRGLWSQGEMDELCADTLQFQIDIGEGNLQERYGNRQADPSGQKSSQLPSRVYHVNELSQAVDRAVNHSLIEQMTKSWLGEGGCWRLQGLFGIVFQDARPGPESTYSRFGWHTDWQSGPHDPRWPGIAFTIHLDGTSPSNGFLRVVPGSHKWATPAPYENVSVPQEALPTGGHTSTPPPFAMPLTFDHVPGEIALYCQRGDLLFHDSYVWHSAARGTDDDSQRRHIRGVWCSGKENQTADPKRFIQPAAR